MVMTDTARQDLARSFIQNYPDAAARIVEKMRVEAAEEWLPALPHELVGRLLERTLPDFSARICAALPVAKSAAILEMLNTTAAAAVLRNCPLQLRRALLDSISPGTAGHLRMLLNFAVDTVGAWMIADPLVLPIDFTAGEALARLAEQPSEAESDTLIVIDRDRHLRGTVRLAALLRVKADTPLDELVAYIPYALPGRMSLSGAQQHEVWESLQWVPVINRYRQLIGVLRHVDLHRGLEYLEGGQHQSPGLISGGGLAQVYGEAMLAMLGVVSAMTLPVTAERGNSADD